MSPRRADVTLLLPACGEKVGMRGTLHERDAWRVPLTRLALSAQVDLSPQAGRGEGLRQRHHQISRLNLAMNAAKAALLALLICFAFTAWADVAIPPLTGRVVDQTGTLSDSDKAALTQKLKDLETRKGSQIAVLIVPTTQPETIEQFSIRAAEAWKVGRKK